jgi:hypothetical protein
MQWIYAITDIIAALTDLLDALEATLARLAVLAVPVVWICRKMVAILPLSALKKSHGLCLGGTRSVSKKIENITNSVTDYLLAAILPLSQKPLSGA